MSGEIVTWNRETLKPESRVQVDDNVRMFARAVDLRSGTVADTGKDDTLVRIADVKTGRLETTAAESVRRT